MVLLIKLEIKDKIFIYDDDLKNGHKYLPNISPENIKQDSMDYQDKLALFLKALEKDKDASKSKNQELYEETIELYSKKSSFSFLISLFAIKKKNFFRFYVIFNKYHNN